MIQIIRMLFLLCVTTLSQALPAPFVYLHQVAPSIIQDMRYASSNNFTGRPVPGYNSPRCILTLQAAKQLQLIQAKAKKKGYSLKVYDCYRPQKAVDAFNRWSQNLSDQKTKAAYYPREKKDTLFDKGYIAHYSGHTRGSTVDLTLVKQDKTGTHSLDMRTPFDYFDKRTHAYYSGLSKAQKHNRMVLRRLMTGNGFKPYSKEWWHFTLSKEPFPKKYFNFPVQ
jgi:zinc D-Ala-D-Ala dipeptidase